MTSIEYRAGYYKGLEQGRAEREKLIAALKSIHVQAAEAIRIDPADWSAIYQIEADARAVLEEVQRKEGE